MLVTIIRTGEMRVCPVSVDDLAVHMRALRHTGIAIRVDVQV